MADNVGYTPGSGAVIAADDIGGVLHQRVKIGVGSDGTAVDVSSANPMPVADATAEVSRQDMLLMLTRVLNYLNAPQGYDKSLQRQRGTVVVESGTVTTVSTVTTVTTCSTVTNLTNITGNIGNYQANQQVWGQNQAAWAALVRARIT
jgi:hypothetical protein